jgi:hypothetical protein
MTLGRAPEHFWTLRLLSDGQYERDIVGCTWDETLSDGECPLAHIERTMTEGTARTREQFEAGCKELEETFGKPKMSCGSERDALSDHFDCQEQINKLVEQGDKRLLIVMLMQDCTSRLVLLDDAERVASERKEPSFVGKKAGCLQEQDARKLGLI